VQVTNADEKGIEVRFLMSAADSSAAWDLRCFIRENMIKFVQENYPGSLPFYRTDYRDGRGETESNPESPNTQSDDRGNAV
jgi:hypothetical protein